MSSFKDTKVFNSVNLNTLKLQLLEYNYTDTIAVKCIEKDYSCFILIDGEVQEEKINTLFKDKPMVYKYNMYLEELTFNDLKLEKLERYNIVFEYSCNKERKCTEAIVFTDETRYIFNDINTKPIVVSSISEIENYFHDKIQEVKDAF